MSFYGTDVIYLSKRSKTHFKTLFLDKRDLCKFKKIPMLPVSRFMGVTKIKGKEREISFHPHFIYEGFTYL